MIATPVMTIGVPGALKTFMDRFQVFYCAKYRRRTSLVPEGKREHRRTLLIAISGMDLPENFDGSRVSVSAFCDIIDCRLADVTLHPGHGYKKDHRKFSDLLGEAYRKGRDLGERAVSALSRTDDT